MILSSLSDINSGVNLKKHPQGSVLYLKAGDINDEGILLPSLKPTVLPESRLKKHYLKKEDVLVLGKGHYGFYSYPINSIGIPTVASSVFLVVKNLSEKLVPQYLAWYINLESTQQELRNKSRGSALPTINKKILGNLDIPIPDISLQKDLVEFHQLKQRESKLLEQIDELKTRALEIKLKQLTKQIHG